MNDCFDETIVLFVSADQMIEQFDWNYGIMLGNEFLGNDTDFTDLDRDRGWSGKIKMLEIDHSVLTRDEILRRVSERFTD